MDLVDPDSDFLILKQNPDLESDLKNILLNLETYRIRSPSIAFWIRI